MKKELKQFIRECEICQKIKHDNASPAGLLQPFPIPLQIWSDLSMNFVEGLPLSNGHSVILVVVDRLSKYSHFISLAHPYTSSKVTHIFVAHIIKLHGMLTSIVSDHDPKFTSAFWRELCRL
jgi:hypothetical protein